MFTGYAERMNHNYKMLIMYDGTPFSGWQVQPNGDSIQQKIQDAIKVITKTDVHIIGSGRTDAGVHALGQVANFKIDKELELRRFLNSLNGLLPPEIRIKEILPTVPGFHARYSAKKKTYRYHVHSGRYRNPFKRLYSWHHLEAFDLDLIKDSSLKLIGEHNFLSFANEAHKGSASKDPVRTLFRLDITEQEEEIIFELEADGFLYKMVRNIIGTLFEIGSGKLAGDSIPRILAAKDRRQAGSTAPPEGLFLVKVDY